MELLDIEEVGTFDLDRLTAEAMQRITYFINRMAAQQQRRMREHWGKS